MIAGQHFENVEYLLGQFPRLIGCVVEDTNGKGVVASTYLGKELSETSGVIVTQNKRLAG